MISVVTPSWNQGRYLAGCIDSVLAQGWPDTEHLVLDNCSKDETPSVLARYPHVTAIVAPDEGQSQAVNRGFARARGEVLAWLNCDDRYLPGAFDRVASAFRDPNVHVVYGHVMVRDERTGRERLHRAHFGNRLDLVTWSHTKLHQPAVFVRRSAIEAVGPLREDLHYTMDMELWWRLSERFAFHNLDVPLALQTYHAEAKTVRAYAAVLAERKRVFNPLLRVYAGDRRWSWLWCRQRNIARRYLSLAAQRGGSMGAPLAQAVLEYPPVLFGRTLWSVVWHRVSGTDHHGRLGP